MSSATRQATAAFQKACALVMLVTFGYFAGPAAAAESCVQAPETVVAATLSRVERAAGTSDSSLLARVPAESSSNQMPAGRPGAQIITLTMPGIRPDPGNLKLSEQRDRVEDIQSAGWRGRMAAGALAATDCNLVAFDVVVAGTEKRSGPLSGFLRSAPGVDIVDQAPRLGQTSTALAMKQVEANLATISASYPQVTSAKPSVIDVDPTTNLFGLAVELRAERPDLLAASLGDLLIGPTNGLLGADALISGMAVTLVDADGHLRAGQWSTSRPGSTSGSVDTMMAPAASYAVKLQFPLITDGPPALSAASGAPPNSIGSIPRLLRGPQ